MNDLNEQGIGEMNMPAISAHSYGLIPTTMTEAMRLAEMMASAKLVPKDLQKSPADCLMVIQQAVRWQMDPFAVAQECSVIQGKLMHSGKLVAAVINARGNLADRLSFAFDGEGDDRTITVTGRFRGEGDFRQVTVRTKDARTNNRVWQTQPDQQLMYHGSRVWARRHAPELMLGVYSPEEFEDNRPAITKKAEMIAASGRLPKKDARLMYEQMEIELNSCTSLPQLNQWCNDNAGRFKVLPEDWEQILELQIQEREAMFRNGHDADGVAWEEGGERPTTPEDFESPEAGYSAAMAAAPSVNSPSTGGAAVLTETETIQRFALDLWNAAEAGMTALSAEWKLIPMRYRAALMAEKDKAKVRAAEVDKEANG